MNAMSEPSTKEPFLPPRWFIRAFWVAQRAACSLTGGRLGLRTATDDRWGSMRLADRRPPHRARSGSPSSATSRTAPNLVTMAMNGWADPEPAWWLNLQAQPDATVDLPGGTRAPSTPAPPAPTSAPASGRVWAAATTRISTPTPPAGPARPRS